MINTKSTPEMTAIPSPCNKYIDLREALKKSNIVYIGGGGGQDHSSLHFFFQKHGLKWLIIAL